VGGGGVWGGGVGGVGVATGVKGVCVAMVCGREDGGGLYGRGGVRLGKVVAGSANPVRGVVSRWGVR